ncbi:MAG TPA: hypothetical protein VLF93_04225 [Candidatus Saccharimonadales bacterium]|nr:hypothetical protein [Candidatus Saccharimonadales bacterium]
MIGEPGSHRIPSIEAIPAQLEVATRAYAEVASQVTGRRLFGGIKLPKPEQLGDLFRQQHVRWQGDGTYALMDSATLEGQGNVEYTLFVAPNIPTDSRKIRGLTEKLADNLYKKRVQTGGLSTPTFIGMNDPLYAQYEADELAGYKKGDAPVRFGLISDSLLGFSGDDLLIRGHEDVPHHIPSVLEAVTLWYARFAGDKLGTDGLSDDVPVRLNGDFKGIHHKNLPLKPDTSGTLIRPWTYLFGYDQLRLEGFGIKERSSTRYVIGSQ